MIRLHAGRRWGKTALTPAQWDQIEGLARRLVDQSNPSSALTMQRVQFNLAVVFVWLNEHGWTTNELARVVVLTRLDASELTELLRELGLLA